MTRVKQEKLEDLRKNMCSDPNCLLRHKQFAPKEKDSLGACF